MRVVIYSDNTLGLRTSDLCALLSSACKQIEFVPGTVPVRLVGAVIAKPTYTKLPPELLAEVAKYDLAVVATTLAHDNNFFFKSDRAPVIVSFADWNELTELSVANGLAFFIASMICDKEGVGDTHHENTGCLNDFWWDKTSVDVGMRAAFLCGACRDGHQDSAHVRDVEAILELVASSSRRRVNILDLYQAQQADPGFDVFLCHNSQDKPTLRELNAALKAGGIKTWLDEDEFPLGHPWQSELEKQIASVNAACVCAGATGLGPWQDLEMRAFISQFVKRGCPVIPVLLPCARSVPDLPIFLQQMMWVDLRTDYAKGVAKLVGALRPRAFTQRGN